MTESWIGTVLATLGEHIRRLEDENRELRGIVEHGRHSQAEAGPAARASRVDGRCHDADAGGHSAPAESAGSLQRPLAVDGDRSAPDREPGGPA